MAEYYFKEFEDYVKLLCQQHTQLLHVDGQNTAFVRMQSEEDVNSIPNTASKSLVVMDNYIGRAIGEFEDNAIVQVPTLLFITYADNNAGNPYAAIQLAMRTSMGILFDFYNRMKYDKLNDDCGPMRYLVAEQMNFSPIDGPVLESHYGWEMTIPFNSKAPAYDPAKWNIV